MSGLLIKQHLLKISLKLLREIALLALRFDLGALALDFRKGRKDISLCLCTFVCVKQVSVDPPALHTTEQSTQTDVGPLDELQTQKAGIQEISEEVLPHCLVNSQI